MVTRTRFNVTLYVHCLSRSVFYAISRRQVRKPNGENKVVSSNTTELLDIVYSQQLTVNGTTTNRPGLNEEQENTAASRRVAI
jgi:hypothetical protein